MAFNEGDPVNGLIGTAIIVAASNASDASKKAALASGGYVCDGTDDDVEIQAAIDALPAGGGKVTLSEGQYNISSSIILPDIYFLIEGQGWVNTILKLTNGADCNLFDDVGSTNTFLPTFRNLYLDGNTDNNSAGSGIYLASGFAYDLKVEDCAIYSFADSGIYIDGGWAHYISGCLFEFNNYALWLDTGSECRVLGNKFLNNSRDIKVVVLYDSVISDNIFGAASVRSIWLLHNPQGLKIIGNSFHGCAVGIYFDTTEVVYTKNLLVANNSFEDIPDTNAIQALGEQDITTSLVTGNTFLDCPRPIEDIKNLPGVICFDQHSDLFMDVLAVSAIHIRSNEDLSAATPITFTIDNQPDVPRTLSWAFDSHAQITEYDMEVVGIDAKGNTVTETWDETAGWSGETSNAFATITSIKMTSRTGTGAGDTMDIGITDVLGLSNIIYETGDVYKIKKNNANAVVSGAQVDTDYDTYDMSVIGLASGDDFTIWYRSNLNIVA